ncbi:MAG: MFS transporter [Clostridia bacterium]|nr:MFS transporter [Clostridia bacterium]
MAKDREVMPRERHPNHIGVKEAAGYMAGEAGNMFSLTYISSFLKVFYTDVLRLPTQKVARIFLFSRLWDAVNDPLWGAIVAKRKPTASGKYRPYLKWLAVPLAVSQLLCFINVGSFTQSQALLLTFAYCTYILFGMMYTGMNVPFGSLASVITDDPEGRTLLSTFRSIGTGIGAAAPMLLAPMLIYSKVDDGRGGTYNVANGRGMFLFALVMSVCAIVFYFTGYAATKERVHSDPHASVDMKKTYGGMLRSKPFVILALSGILISGQLQFASLNQYLYKNYFCNTSLSALGTVAQYLPTVIMLPLTPRLVRRFGKKELSTVGSLFAAIGAILVFLLRPAPDNPALFLGMQFWIGFGYCIVSITNWAVVTDVIDYQQFVTGEHSESAIYAVYTFCRKLGQTIADYGGLMLLARVGYSAETMADAGFVSGVSEGILRVCTAIPAVVYSLIFVLYALYPLTKKRLEPIYAHVRAVNAAGSDASVSENHSA